MKDQVVPFGHGDDVERVCGWVDHGSAGDAELWCDGKTIQDIGDTGRGLSCRGIGEADLPERGTVRAGIGIRVECIDAVVLGGYEHNVVNSLAGDRDGGEVERLGVELSIDRPGEELAELNRVDVRGSEKGFRKILACPGEIVAISGNADLGARAIRQRKNQES